MEHRSSILKGPIAGPFSFFLLSLLAFAPALFSQYLVNPDAQFILERLLKTPSLIAYLNDLFSLRTLDFQPLRDLSFVLDLKFYTWFGFNTAVWQNLCWWVLAAVTMQKILDELYPEKREAHWYLVMLFCVYPLFSQTVPWGVARKHLMAFSFIMFATYEVLKHEKLDTKSQIKILFFYSLSIFSQPISMLWPFWLFTWMKWGKQDRLKENGKLLVSAFGIFIFCAVINKLYYSYSPVYLASYQAKADDPFNMGDKLLGLGHYIFQLIFPYLLSFRYDLGHWSSLIGLIIVIATCLILYKKKHQVKHALLWSWFALLPLSLVLIDSKMLYDTYLLIPAAGMLIGITPYIHNLLSKSKTPYFIAPLVLVFTALSFNHSRAWTDELLMVKKSFENQPSCLSASDYLKISYENEKPTPLPAKKFLYEHECEIKYGTGPMTILYTNLLFYENDQPMSDRISQLKSLAVNNIYPHMALIALYIKENMQSEADLEIASFNEKWKNAKFRSEFIPLVARVIYPYCESKENAECLDRTRPFTQKKQQVFYK